MTHIRVDLEQLPLDELILPLLDMRSLSRFEGTCRAFRHPHAWRNVVQCRWGPVVLPPTLDSWCELARVLETNVRPLLSHRVRGAVELLQNQFLKDEVDGEWHKSLRCLLVDPDLKLSEKRRIVAYVCAEWQGPSVLSSFLAPIPIIGATPEAALRNLLLIFPFLPIDAGAGADRVIGYFARTYVRQNPRALSHLIEPDGVDGSPSSDESPSSDIGVPSPWERRARDAVYTLIYAIIMLNTDLHNPAIQPKISRSEFAASCRRCTPLVHLDDPYLFDIYDRLWEHPLVISTSEGPVTSSVRASANGADVESHATYSIYSSIAAPLEGGILGAPRRDRQRGQSTHPPPPATRPDVVTIDWSVAYWNCVDLVRYLRAATGRRLTAVVQHGGVGPLHWLQSSTLGVMALLVAGIAVTWRLGAALHDTHGSPLS